MGSSIVVKRNLPAHRPSTLSVYRGTVFSLLLAQFFLFFAITMHPSAPAIAHDVPMEIKAPLTAEELKWLKEHPLIRLAPDPDFPPVEYLDARGKYLGIAADFLALIEKKFPSPLK